MPSQQQLTQHYADSQLLERLNTALIAANLNPQQLSLDDLAPIDQLHLGGRQASRQLAQQANLPKQAKVLDLGCGLGGSSRLLASEYQAQVTGVDITPEFVTAAHRFNCATGLNSQIETICADAQHLPFATASFDAVWSQHTLMNLPNLELALTEIKRVLKPQGLLLMHELFQGENLAELAYPVPWASTPNNSHLRKLETYTNLLNGLGFQLLNQTDVTQAALTWRSKHRSQEASGQAPTKNGLTAQVVFGARFLHMGKNLHANLAQNKLVLIQAVWQS